MSAPAESSVSPPATGELTWHRFDAQLDAATLDARSIVDGLDETQGRWRPAPDRWSVAECLAHLAVTARVYLPVLDDAVRRGRAAGHTTADPFRPGFVSRWLVATMEPPPRRAMRSQRSILPQSDVSLSQAVGDFMETQDALRAQVASAAGLDLGGVRLRSPLMPLLRLSLGTCFGFLAAHERRHLWQARRVREALLDGGTVR